MAWYLFFFYQGKAIELAVHQGDVYPQLISTLMCFVGIKLVVMCCDIFQNFASSSFQNNEIRKQWMTRFPKKIYKDNEEQHNLVQVLFFDYLPSLFDLEGLILVNKVTFLLITFMGLLLFIYAQVWFGILSFVSIFLLNYFGRNTCVATLDKHQKATNLNKVLLLNWVNQFFKSYREISKNWGKSITSNWSKTRYDAFFLSNKKIAQFQLYRSFMGQFSVEIPFLLNTALLILGLYHAYLSITQLFIWIGVSQFAINASNAHFENKVNVKKRDMLKHQAQDVFQALEVLEDTQDEFTNMKEVPQVVVALRDGTINKLGIKPSLYHIKGNNGSGKSTLLNIILGYERKLYVTPDDDLRRLLKPIESKHIRLIEREAIIFDALHDFEEQVFGPNYQGENTWQVVVRDRMRCLFDRSLTEKWLLKFGELEAKYKQREDKRLSSGEKVMLSFMRFLISWDASVKILVIDECDLFLAHDMRKLFYQSMDRCSKYMAVYMSTHAFVHASVELEPMYLIKTTI